MPVPNFVRRLLLLIFGKYDFWRIYSVETAQCREPELRFDITRIEDLAIFDIPALEPELPACQLFMPGRLRIRCLAWQRLGGSLLAVARIFVE